MKKDLFEQNPHEKNTESGYALAAFKGYTPDVFWRHVSAAQFSAVTQILNQANNHYICNEGGIEVTLLFTAWDSQADEQVAVYIADDFEIATCPLEEFHDEFSKV